MHTRCLSRSALAAAVAGGLSLVLATPPVFADGTADAWNNGDSIGAGAASAGTPAGGSKGKGGGGGGGGGGAKPTCSYEALAPEFQTKADGMSKNGWEEETGDGDGLWYRKICEDGSGSSSAEVVWVPRRAVDLKALARQALQNTPLPTPLIGMNPRPGQAQVVNIPTWLWIEPAAWAPVSATASAGGVTVQATAGPRSVIWDMGNGDKVTCDGPGTPYDHTRRNAEQRPTCSYTYRHSSAGAPGGAFKITATVVWGVRWGVVGGGGGGDLGTARRTATVAVRVAEIQAVNRPAGQGG